MSPFLLFAEAPDGGAVCGLAVLVFVGLIFGVVFLSTLVKGMRQTWKNTWKD